MFGCNNFRNFYDKQEINDKYLFSFSFSLLSDSLCCVFCDKRIYVVDDSPPIAEHVIYQTSRHRSIIRQFSTSYDYFISIYLMHLIRLLSSISNFSFLTFSFLLKTTNKQYADLNI